MLDVRNVSIAGIVFWLFFAAAVLRAEVVEYDLTVAEEEVNITGEPSKGMTLNGGIPGPTLYFKEGDTALIHVHNRMDVETSIHWHGVLVPNDMDGVPYLTYPPIAAGTTFTYELPIRQAGTYWYHSHTSLQEQSGLYGALVIEPGQKRLSPDQDHVIVLSDWSNEAPDRILRTLKRGSEWYALEKGSSQSILGAARLGMVGDYFKRELQRMPAMDIADVAYDRFLANGKPENTLPAKAGETVRLRVIDGSSTTFFHLSYAGGPMTIVAADGQDVEPVDVDRLLIGVAETYDVLVKVPTEGAFEFRATAHDASAFTSVWIGSGERRAAPAVPKPNLYHSMEHLGLKSLFAFTPAGVMGMPDGDVKAGKFDQPGMMHMGGMHHSGHGGHDMGVDEMQHAEQTGGPAAHSHFDRDGKGFEKNFGFLAADVSSAKDLALDGMDPRRPWPPYDKLRATRSTAFSEDRPVREIRLTLDGDMERYVWFLNNKALSESDDILIHRDEVVRFVMINRTMMHHPMHLHGHFFRVINGQGDYAPLKHTVDVAPMSTTVIEFDANEFGDWFFHCHLLYHMMSGMARVVHYEDFTLSPELAAVRPMLYMDEWYFWGEIDAMSHMGEGFLMVSNTRHVLAADWEYGWEDVEDPEWEVTPTWGYYLNRFTTVFVGIDFEGEKDEVDTHNGVVGFHYLLPMNVEFMTWMDVNTDFRFAAEKTLELAPRLMAFGEAEYDTKTKWEGHAGLAYMINKSISLIGQWHSDFGLGGGVRVRF